MTASRALLLASGQPSHIDQTSSHVELYGAVFFGFAIDPLDRRVAMRIISHEIDAGETSIRPVSLASLRPARVEPLGRIRVGQGERRRSILRSCPVL
ncbi:MAG: hypothetical protein R3C56_24075 [Pirellulaceae bacterium]